MAKEKTIQDMEEVQVETRTDKLVPPAEGGPVNVIKNLASPVKSRVQARRTHLLELTKTKHEKWKHGNTPKWIDTPPKYHLGSIELRLNGGVGEITYTVLMRNPVNGNKVRTPGGGPIEQFLVTERFQQGKAMSQEILEGEGIPSITEAMKTWDDHIQAEKDIVKTRRGI